MTLPKEYTRSQVEIDINELRKQHPDYLNITPFSHQQRAHEELNKRFNTIPPTDHKAGLLVLPTGSGKTFTAVNWIFKKIIPKNVKVLWLAHTGFLLSQAAETFYMNALSTTDRDKIFMRVVSSSKYHDYPKNIKPIDDILIITTQTAIKQFNLDNIGSDGSVEDIAIQKWFESCKESGLLVVLDEAHHAPASGCRKLLQDIEKFVPNTYLLGLTATPMHNDHRISGWLPKLFGEEPIYKVTKDELIAANILAKPIFKQMETGISQQLSDQDFFKIVRDKQEIPDHIIDDLAKNQMRNEYIAQTYVQNKTVYKKTIIFADRWYQCLDIQKRINRLDNSIKINSIYTCSRIDPEASDAYKSPSINDEILDDFKTGKFDVLLNIKILTEGADVPDVNTVFLTRQTTSPILITQMIGRCLRGELAGGGKDKRDANIVMFIDDWKRVIDFADPRVDGGIGGTGKEPIYRKALDKISITLGDIIGRQIDSGEVFNTCPYLSFLPIGWYVTNITEDTYIDIEGESCDNEDKIESYETYTEILMVYDTEKNSYQLFIENLLTSCPDNWNIQKPFDENIREEIITKAKNFFKIDEISTNNKENLIKIAKHIAQNGAMPEFFQFEDREQYNLDKLVEQYVPLKIDDLDLDEKLCEEYNKNGSFWPAFYHTYEKFCTAYDAAKRYHIRKIRKISPPIMPPPPPKPLPRLRFTEEECMQIHIRDKETCQCCGAKRKLECDHIIPVTKGGQTTISNGQLLCSKCHSLKGELSINYISNNHTPLSIQPSINPNSLMKRTKDEEPEITLRRIVNNYYRCSAVSEIKLHTKKSGKHYSIWKVRLFPENNADWINSEKNKILNFFKDSEKFNQLVDIEIK